MDKPLDTLPTKQQWNRSHLRRSLSALVLTTGLALAGCTATPATPSPEPATTTTPTQSEATEATTEPAPSPTTAAQSDSWPIVDPSEEGIPMDDDFDPNFGLSDEALANYDECVSDAIEASSGADATGLIELCDELAQFEMQMDDLGEQVANNPKWQCWLDLEKTRPELFESADPEQYSQDPEVIKVCG